jgi:competence protein ComEC
LPLQFALLAFALGVVVLQAQAALPDPHLALCIPLFALLWWLLGRRTRFAVLLLALAAGSGGFFYAAWRAELRLADALPAASEGRDIRLTGVVDELPQSTDRGIRFAFAVESFIPREAGVPPRVSLAWYSGFVAGTASDVPVLHAVERWSLAVRLKRPHGTVNPQGFDVEAWLLANDLRATGYVRKDEANRRIDAFAGRAEDLVARARETIRDRILHALGDRPYAGVIAALAIGDERAIPPAQWLLFNRTGIGHLISISGLHVTFFATLVGALVFWVWKRSHALTLRLPARKAAAIGGVLAAFGYVLLAGFAVPAQRTLYMLMVAAAGLWLARPGTAAVVWLWALAVVLLYDPWASLTPGFWLSFGAVGLLLYTGVGRIGRTTAWRAAVRAQTAITLGLIPLMLVLFQQVSIVSPAANAVAIPVVTFIVVPLTLASIALPWDGLLAIAHQVFAWLALLLEFLSDLPAAVWQQHAPPLWTALAGAIGVLWLLSPRGVPARMLGLAWLAPLFVVVPPPPAPGTFRVTVLDVGQGLAVLVQTHAHALLYDTGPRFNDSADAGNRIIAPMLRASGIRALDALVVSHQDSDHSGGALSLLQTVPVGWLDSSLAEQNAIVVAQRARRSGAALHRGNALGMGRRGIRHPLSVRLDLPRAADQDQ